MPITYENLNLPGEGEVSLADVVKQLEIPRRTVLRYAKVFGDFVPNAVRKPPLGKPEKRGRRRILYFEAVAFDILPTIRDLSRRRLSHVEIRRILVESKGRIISTRTKEKIAPLIIELQSRQNSLPELDELPADFNFAPLAKAVKVIEGEFSVRLPVDVKKVGEDKFDKILFLINTLFQFHLQENLDGSELENRIRDYFKGVHAMTKEVEKLQHWLGSVMGIGGRWSKKNRFVLDLFSYEFIEIGGMNSSEMRKILMACSTRFQNLHMTVPECMESWLILLKVVRGRKYLVLESEMSDDVVELLVREWGQLFEVWKENLIEL